MLADVAEKYYIEGDYNCAESVVLAANEMYGLGLDENAYQLLSAFGGGMGCGGVCGALAGALSVLGKVNVTGRAHATKGFRTLCSSCVLEIEKELGGRNCDQLKPVYFAAEKRCLKTVRIACDVLERRLDAAKAGDA